MILLTVTTGQPLTGGYIYNNGIARELGDLPDTFLLVDSIFFAFPDTLQSFLSQREKADTGEPVLLLHWLPWVEERIISGDPFLRDNPVLSYPPLTAPGEQALKLLGKFSRFIVSSRFSRDELTARGVDERRICIAEPGLDAVLAAGGKGPAVEKEGASISGCSVADAAAARFRFATLSHWSPVKGIHRLLPLFDHLDGLDWEWHAVGDSNPQTAYGREMLQTISRTPYRDRCVLHGVLPPPAAWDCIAHCNCLIQPSLFETYGMAAAESAALGVPVIGMDTGGVSEAVREGRDGILCKTENQFLQTVRQAAVNPDILPRPGLTGEKEKDQTWKATAAIIRNFLLGGTSG